MAATGVPTEPVRIPLNVLFGISDDRRARVHVLDEGRRLEYALPGTANIIPFLSTERFVLNIIYLQHGNPVPIRLNAGPLLNHIADPDICSRSLKIAEQIAEKSARPCFNHPSAVARTSRDAVSRLLSGMSGVTVPQTLRVNPLTASDVPKAIEEAGLTYPVLLRIPGSHGGSKFEKVDNAERAHEVAGWPRAEDALYVTKFYDFVSPDGLYRKFRVVVVGDDIFLRTCIVGGNWLLGRGRRAANSEKEERVRLASFDEELGPRLKPVFREMRLRLGLDYFGVDCNIDEQGQVLLFEANACMNILSNNFPSPNIWDAVIERITIAVERLLATPSTWQSPKADAKVLKTPA